MNKKAEVLRKELADAQAKMLALKEQVTQMVSLCNHKWSNPEAAHIYHPAYQSAGDPIGTCGVDRRLPMYIPSRTDKRWKRTCLECGDEQFTTHVTSHTIETPRF